MKYGVQTRFKAKVGKKREDGSIVYHDNALIDFILKLWYGRRCK